MSAKTTARPITETLAIAGERVRSATRERDEMIAMIAATGEMSQREIARAVGLSHTAVQVIIRRATAA